MRRLLVAFLSIVILLPCICVGVNAEENYTFYKINIDSGSGAIGEKAIVQDGEIYISADSFSNYTRFTFDKETKTFLIKGQELKKAFKSVVIDIAKKRMLISGKKFFELSDCFEIEGEIYLPLCQMLPILNADIYEIKDNIIYISNNKLSLAEVLYDFDISDYYFNISTEFYDMDWAVLLTIVPNYVWDTVVDVRFDRLDIVYNSGEYNDYKDAFSSFISDDNLYLKAKAEDASAIDSTVEFFNKANSTAKDMKSVYGWVEAAGKSEISSETGGALLDSLKAYYDSGDLKTDDLKGLNDAWTGGKISFGDCIEILTYVYTYATQVEDNRQMLNAVYIVDSKITKKETARKAAKQVYDLYGDNIVPALYKEIATTVASDTLEDLSPIGVYTATAKVAGTVLETFMPFEPGEIAKLPVYSDVVLSAASKYRAYDTMTDESTNNLRLSLLLCMIASKKCYEVMADVFDEDTSYYKSKVEKIEQLIMGLYIAEENTEFDSFEHFEKYKKVNLEKIEKSNFFDNLPNMELSQTPEAYIIDSNKLLNDGKLKAALLVLYECIEVLGDSDIIQEAIDDYFTRVTLISSANPKPCDEKYCFEDTTYPKSTACTEGDIGLLLVDSKSGAKETIARITLKYENGYYPPKDDDATIVGNNDDTWLFYTFSGAGKCSTFLYTIHTNKLSILKDAPVDWHITNNILIGTTIAFAVGDEISLFAYDWTGNVLYSKEELLAGTTVKDGWIYFSKSTSSKNKTIYKIYKMKIDGTNEKQICSIEASSGGYLSVDGDNIIWYDEGKENKMSLYNPYDVTLKEASNSTPSWKEETSETQTLIKKALNYLQTNYSNEKIYELEFYADNDGIISCYVKSENDLSAYFAAEINKSTKKVSLFNMFGREIESFYLT